MFDLLVTILIFIIVAAVFLWVARLAIAAVASMGVPPGTPAPAPRPIWNLVYAIVVLLVLFVFLNEIGWVGEPRSWRGGHHTRVFR